jgi:hypothetical protein
VIDSRLVNQGCIGTGVCITQQNTVEFIPMTRAKDTKWTRYPCVLRTGPRLVQDGVANVEPWREGFRDRALFRPAIRSALGMTRSNKLLLVTVTRPIYLGKLARIMRELGAVDAVNLDGGSSTALSYRGRVITHPSRRLTNLFLVYESPIAFERIKSALTPLPLMARRNSK